MEELAVETIYAFNQKNENQGPGFFVTVII